MVAVVATLWLSCQLCNRVAERWRYLCVKTLVVMAHSHNHSHGGGVRNTPVRILYLCLIIDRALSRLCKEVMLFPFINKVEKSQNLFSTCSFALTSTVPPSCARRRRPFAGLPPNGHRAMHASLPWRSCQVHSCHILPLGMCCSR